MAYVRLPSSPSITVSASAGIGLRPQHYGDVLITRPKVGWFEVHSENYFGKGGAPFYYLEKIREDYPVSLHGVGMSLGSVDALDVQHLAELKGLIERIRPGLVSEHLSWCSFGGDYLNDLVPLPYTDEALVHLIGRLSQAQDTLGRQILVENPSSYLEYDYSTYREYEFLNELSRRTGCGILLDVNNVYVSCRNHGWDALEYLQGIAADRVGEIHLAGHTVNRVSGQDILIDTHNRPVCAEVWALYQTALQLMGAKPSLIEWDTDVPALSILVDEAKQAASYLGAGYEHAA
ncbi:hypothetical protein UPF0276 [Methyloglobulus morosus KoM1]|uniref:UPF0276 protein MGMO_17c00080 n=1 Tax=Methyloglobulus morosus KoM1 TaxID=1116472 RepID=V5C9S5_9GAMM|nr:DUF692 domain-containing protein [Methyloglobulus morosus]ESS73543.1 hypothetical protein UPF0276 [Methyloglobulus morosus KoM1]